MMQQGVNKAALLEFISTASFVLDDLRLYLDTHPKDQNALDMYSDYQRIRDGAVADYEKYCGPLNQYNIPEDNKWIWVKGPWPWQGEV